MAIRRITDNLIQITQFSMVNCYLVLDGDQDGERTASAIDVGIPGAENLLVRASELYGVTITRVLLTHAHFDHVGGLDALSARLPDAEYLFTERSAALLSGDLSLRPDEPQTPLKGGFSERDTPPTRLIVDGDRIGSLRAVSSPGHSPDHTAYFDERDGTLICGDAFQTKGGIAVAGVPRLLFPLPAVGTWDNALSARSARTLADTRPTRLAPGHGRVLDAPQAAMMRAIEEAERRLGK